MAPNNHGGTVTATIGGTVLSIAANIGSDDVLKTVVLAALGAVVSFIVSLLMKRLFRKTDDLQRPEGR